jgi:hypothetical protein
MAATVLVVEDERKLRELVRCYLERAGFTVLTTDSGAEALTLAGSAAPDLVILDLGLPDVAGDRGPRAAYVRPYADPDAHGQGVPRKTGSAVWITLGGSHRGLPGTGSPG